MLIEGHCTIGVHESIKKYGYTEQRYYQLLEKYRKECAQGLIDKKTGSDKKPVKTKQIRLGSWDLIKGFTGFGVMDIEPRIAMQLVNEAAFLQQPGKKK